MALQASADTIGSWTASQLTKVIKDLFEQQPNVQYNQLQVGVLAVTDELRVKGKVTLTNKENFITVGSTGAASFTNAWANFGAPYYNAAYWLDPFNFVHLRGNIKSGTIGLAAFTLPPGYRPSATISLPVESNGAFGSVTISSGGVVTPTVGSNVRVSLDSIIYKI